MRVLGFEVYHEGDGCDCVVQPDEAPAGVGVLGFRGMRVGGWGGSEFGVQASERKVDVRLPGKGNLNSHGARPV